MPHPLFVPKRAPGLFSSAVYTSLVLLSVTVAFGQPTDTASLGTRPVAGLFRPEVLEQYQIPGERQVSQLLRPVAIALLEQQGLDGSRPAAEVFLPGILEQYGIRAARPVGSMLRAESLTKVPRYEAPSNHSVAEILRGYHLTVAPLSAIRIEPPFVVATTQSDALIVPFALDYVVWTAPADRAFEEILTRHRSAGKAGPVEVWVTGSVSPYAKLQLALRRIEVKEHVGNRIPFID